MERKNTSELPPSLQRHIIRRDADELPSIPPRREGHILPPLSGPSSLPPVSYSRYQGRTVSPSTLGDSIRHFPGPATLIGQANPSPIYSDPIYHSSRVQPGTRSTYPSPSHSHLHEAPRPEPPWQEGEAGPSSLMHAHRMMTDRGDEGPRFRLPRISPPPIHQQAGQSQPPHQPLSYDLGASQFGRPERPSQLSSYAPATEVGVSQSWPGQSYSSTSAARYETHPSAQPDPQQRAWSGISSSRDPGSGSRSESGDPRTSMSRTPEATTTEGEGSSRGRTSAARHPRGPRKTEVACNFCRGRKLRCDGGRPACYNCSTRNRECTYDAQPRRRGPGRAPKGSKPRRKESGTASSSQKGDSPPPQTPISETTQQFEDEGSYDEDEPRSSSAPRGVWRRGEEG